MIHATDKDAATSNSQIHRNNPPATTDATTKKATQRTNRQNQRSYAKISDSTDACARSYMRYHGNQRFLVIPNGRCKRQQPISDFFLQYSAKRDQNKFRQKLAISNDSLNGRFSDSMLPDQCSHFPTLCTKCSLFSFPCSCKAQLTLAS